MATNKEIIERNRNIRKAFNDSVEKVADIFATGGYLPTDDPKSSSTQAIELKHLKDAVTDIVEYEASKSNVWDKDAIHVEDIPEVIQTSVVRSVARAAEPNLVLTPLLSRIQMEEDEIFSEEFMGSIVGIADWLSPNDEPPLVTPLSTQSTAGQYLKKFGLMLEFDETLLRRSRWNIIQFHLEEAAKDMARFKEQQTARMLATNANYRIEGDSSTTSTLTRYGVAVAEHASNAISSGRAQGTLALNETITLDDLFDMMNELITLNVFPDLLVMHPFAWRAFAQNGELREFAMMNGQTPLMRSPEGNAGIRSSHEPGTIVPTQQARSENATLYVNVPNLFPRPLQIVVSPFAFLDTTNNKADIIMGVSGQMGIELVGAGPTTNRWNDPVHDMQNIKIQEYWNVLPKNNGDYLIGAYDITLAASADVKTIVSLSSLP